MRCEPGDLVIIVSSGGGCGIVAEVAAKCVGRIGRVTRFRPSQVPSCMFAMVWELEEPMRVWHAGRIWTVTGAADHTLRPIRPGDGADETLAWAGKPAQVPA